MFVTFVGEKEALLFRTYAQVSFYVKQKTLFLNKYCDYASLKE